MYGRIHTVHTQLVEAKHVAALAAQKQIRVPGKPSLRPGVPVTPELVLYLEDAVFFLSRQCLTLNAAVIQLQERFDERSGDGAGSVIVQEGCGSSGPGDGQKPI
jgi:hypothetical protein